MLRWKGSLDLWTQDHWVQLLARHRTPQESHHCIRNSCKQYPNLFTKFRFCLNSECLCSVYIFGIYFPKCDNPDLRDTRAEGRSKLTSEPESSFVSALLDLAWRLCEWWSLFGREYKTKQIGLLLWATAKKYILWRTFSDPSLWIFFNI